MWTVLPFNFFAPMAHRRTARLSSAVALIAMLLTGPAALAQPLVTPDGPVLLQVTGKIGRTNRNGAMAFDRAMLKQLPRTRFTTTTIWTAGAHSFTGVALDELLAAVAADGNTLRATALNNYEVTMPVAAAQDGPDRRLERRGETDLRL